MIRPNIKKLNKRERQYKQAESDGVIVNRQEFVSYENGVVRIKEAEDPYMIITTKGNLDHTNWGLFEFTV